MSRLILTGLVLLVSGISPVVNAQQKPSKPDFSGNWTLSSGDRGWWGTELKATQSDKTLTVIRTVQRGPLTYLYNLDGSPSHFVTSIGGQDVDQLSMAKWDGSRLVLTTKYRAQGFDQEAMQVWSIDAAGNLTIELTVARNGQADGTGKSVYKKS